MRIKSFRFDDLRTGWHLEETRFDGFNLLVGVSGVGKTKILEAIERVCRIATDSEYNLGWIQWIVEVEISDQTYRWEGKTAESSSADPLGILASSDRPTEIVHEKLVKNEGDVLIDRGADKFKVRGENVPSLKKGASAIALLGEDADISAIRSGFTRVAFSQTGEQIRGGESAIIDDSEHLARTIRSLRDKQAQHGGFDILRVSVTLLGPMTVSGIVTYAYIIQEAFAGEFEKTKDIFINIFPSVSDVRVALKSAQGGTPYTSLELTIQEHGVSRWIPQSEISSGMLRTLFHLFEISLALPGSVILIDEFENSLGVNCMPELTRFILSRSDCQFILTSHHPYVINNIPPETWKLVTRKGGHVRVLSARDIPSLQKTSHQQAFIRLINLPEFEEGIS